MSAQVIFLPPRLITYEEARKHQLMQDHINERRAKLSNWSIGKPLYEVAAAKIAWHNYFKKKIFLIPADFALSDQEKFH